MPATSTPSREARPATAPSIARRWSPRESSVPPRSPPAPLDDEAVLALPRSPPRRRGARRPRSRSDPTPCAGAPRPRRRRPALGEAAQEGHQGQLVDRHGHLVGVDARRDERAVAGDDRPARLAAIVGVLLDLDRGAHPVEDPQQAHAGRIQPDAFEPHRAARHDRRRDQRGRPPRRSRRGLESGPRSRRSAGRDRDPRVAGPPVTGRGAQAQRLDPRAGRPQHPLGVVPRRGRLGHGGLALGEQAGEQHAGLHLGARDGQPVLDPAQAAALDAQRRQAPVAAVHLGAHQAQGLGDAVNGPAADRLVAVERPRSGACPASQPGRIRSSVPAFSTSTSISAPAGAPAGHAAANPRPAFAAAGTSAARAPRPRPERRSARGSPWCRPRRGSRSTVGRPPPPSPPISAARWLIDLSGGRAKGAATAGPRGRSGSRARPTRSSRGRGRSRPARSASASPATHSETAPVRMSGAG